MVLAPVRAACTLPGLWLWLEWTLSESVLEAADPQHAQEGDVLARLVHWSSARGDLPLLQVRPSPDGLEGVYMKNMWVRRHGVSNICTYLLGRGTHSTGTEAGLT